MARGDKIAFVFPGQGSQYVGMGRKTLAAFPQIAKPLYERARQALKLDLRELIFEGSPKELNLTKNAQPAVVLDSVIKAEVLRQGLHLTPNFVAGHSLGEFTALVAAGVLTLEQALVLVQERARLMQEASPREQRMAAVLGRFESWRERWRLRLICSRMGVEIANINSRHQIVIAGLYQAVQEAKKRLERVGFVERVIELKVSIAGHSSLMEQARRRLTEEIAKLDFKPPQIPIITATKGRVLTKTRALRRHLERHMTQRVQWRCCVERLRKQKVALLIEVGPRKVLTGFTEGVRILPFQEAVKELKGG